MATSASQIRSVRPRMTAELMAQTGLNDEILTELVHSFYARIRKDTMLGPIFAARIEDWPLHLDRMVDFWSSVALMTGRYSGTPVPAHTPLPIDRTDFDRWLEIFRETARQVCPPAGAAHVIERAERIASSLDMAVAKAQAAPDAVPSLR